MKIKFIFFCALFSICFLKTKAEIFYVTNSTYSSAHSFVDCVNSSNSHPGKDSIYFNIPDASLDTIRLYNVLIHLTDGVFIDGLTQPNSSVGNLQIKMDRAIICYEASNITVCGIFFNQSSMGSYTNISGPFKVFSNWICENNFFYKSNGFGAYSGAKFNVHDVIVRNNKFIHCTGGISFGASNSSNKSDSICRTNNCRITNNILDSLTGWNSAISIFSSGYYIRFWLDSIVIDSNLISNLNGNPAVYFICSSKTFYLTNVEVNENKIINCYSGILFCGGYGPAASFYNYKNIRIENNYLNKFKGVGVEFSEDYQNHQKTAMDSVFIKNNTIENDSFYAIHFYFARTKRKDTLSSINHVFIENNEIRNSVKDGVRIWIDNLPTDTLKKVQVRNFIISQNSIYNCKTKGINWLYNFDISKPYFSYDYLPIPQLDSVFSYGYYSVVSGHIHGAPNSDLVFEFFSNQISHAVGYSTGEIYLGNCTAHTNSSGYVKYQFVYGGDLAGKYISCTTTGCEENCTSEFSPTELGQSKSYNRNPCFSILPNHSTKEINIVVPPDKTIISLQIFSVDGRKYFEQLSDFSGAMKLYVSSLQQGMYLLELTFSNGETCTQKFVRE